MRILKTLLFLLIFYLLCFPIAYIFKDDYDSYSRIVMHELQQQKKIDIMICGASHVSHGFYPALADEKLGLNTICAGTPGQTIDSTYALIRDVASYSELKDVYLEMDFAVAIGGKFKDRKGLKNVYIVAERLKNPLIKLDFLIHCAGPQFILNSLNPLGAEKYIEIDPQTALKNWKCKLSGEYHKYLPSSAGKKYAGKGCVLEPKFIENGTFWSYLETPIPMDFITDDYTNTIKGIAKFCESKGIKLHFFTMPGADFYSIQKGNYDEYYEFIKNLTAELGYDYYDFNLAKPELLELEDSDFQDDNHFAKNGVIKFTESFMKFFYENPDKEKYFYNTYSEKIAAQDSKILGLMFDEKINGISSKIIPVINNGNKDLITYNIYADLNNGEGSKVIAENTSENEFTYPSNSSGQLKVEAFYNGRKDCSIIKKFTTF